MAWSLSHRKITFWRPIEKGVERNKIFSLDHRGIRPKSNKAIRVNKKEKNEER